MQEKINELKSLTLSAMLNSIMAIFFYAVKFLAMDLSIIFIFIIITSFFYTEQVSLKKIHYFLVPLVLLSSLFLIPYMIIGIILCAILSGVNLFIFSKNKTAFIISLFLSFVSIQIFDLSFSFIILSTDSISIYLNSIETHIINLREKYTDLKLLLTIIYQCSKIIVGTIIFLIPTLCFLLTIFLISSITKIKINIMNTKKLLITLLLIISLLLILSIIYILNIEKLNNYLELILMFIPITYIILSLIIALIIPTIMLMKKHNIIIVTISFITSIVLSIFISIPTLIFVAIKSK